MQANTNIPKCKELPMNKNAMDISIQKCKYMKIRY